MNELQTQIDTKPCPYCCEPIKAEAIYCRWCKKNLKKRNIKSVFLILSGVLFLIIAGNFVSQKITEYQAQVEYKEQRQYEKELDGYKKQAVVELAQQLDDKIAAQRKYRKERERKFGKYYGTADQMEIYGARVVAGDYWPQIVGTVLNSSNSYVVGSAVAAETYDSAGRVLEQPDSLGSVDRLESKQARKFKIECMNSPGINRFKILSCRGMRVTLDGQKSVWGE